MLVADVLKLPACAQAQVVGAGELGRRVELAHVVDVPDTERWVTPGTLLLSTGLSWPRGRAEQEHFAGQLAAREPAAVLLAVPRFFDHFPAPLLAALSARGIPAIELPWDVPFVQVVQQAHEQILREQAEELRRSERIHRALTRAALSGNLADVTGTLSEQLGRPAAVLAAGGGALTPGDAPPTRAAKAALGQAGTGPRPLHGGTLVPLVLRGQREGGVWVGPGGPGAQGRGELAVRAAEHAATVAGLLLLAQRDAELREARLGYAFVDTLLEGQFTADPTAQERAARLGFQPDSTYAVAVLALNVPLPLTPEGFAARERAEAQVRGALRSLDVPPLVSVNLNQVWFLLPEKVTPGRVWARLGEQVVGGLVYGRARVGAPGIAESRAELLSLLPYARPGELRSYAQVLLPRALSGDREAQADLIATLLSPLRQARGGDALLETMRALCQTGFSQVEAAQALGVHPNTLRYRVERIEALTGRPLTDPQVRPLWWLALQLDDLHHA